MEGLSIVGTLVGLETTPMGLRFLHEEPTYTFFPLPSTTGQTIAEWGREHLATTREEAKFLAFLSLYGSSGVPLRELIMLATLRVHVNPSENHWLLSGETGPIFRGIGDATLPANCSFLNAFVRETSTPQGTDGLQKRLLSMGLIVVEPPPRNSPPFDGTWCTDERIWCLAENEMSSHLMVHTWGDSDGKGIIMDLLYVFLEMPSKDVSPLAERHREMFYYHARLFAHEALRCNETVLKDARDYIVWLILQLLTHRHQDGDEKLMLFARAWPSYVNGSDWAIMLLTAELKEVNFRRTSRMKTTLTNRITSLLSWKGRRQRRANGLIGYLLVEWMKATEATQENKLSSQIIISAVDWIESAWASGSSIEGVALCCVLANFQMLDRSVLVSPKYHLFYGHNLSRTGHLEEAGKFLTSGIEYCYRSSHLQWHPKFSSSWMPPKWNHTWMLFTVLWGHEFELVSVLIRLGLSLEAKQRLFDIETLATYRHVYGEKVLKRLGVHAEIKILLDLYYNEWSMAAGTVIIADSQLETAMSTASLVHDGHIQSLHLALQMRLLEVRTRQGSLEKALQTAENLVVKIKDGSLSPDLVQWIIQQLLGLSNRLAWASNTLAASRLLESIFQICRHQHYSDSLKDLLPYTEQRRSTIRNLLQIDFAENDPTAVGYESNASTNEPPEYLEGSSSKDIPLSRNATSHFTDMITVAPTDDSRVAAKNALRNYSWSPIDMRSAGTENEKRSNGQMFLDRDDFMEEPKVLNPAINEPLKKAPLMEPISPRRASEKRPAGKHVMKQGPRRSLAAMLRRAPRAPVTEPGIFLVKSGEIGQAPVSVEPPVVSELATA